MKSVTFRNGAIDMAANLYLPAGLDAVKRHAAIAFDASYQGERRPLAPPCAGRG
ncbi:hypothetical protein [Paenirhodobacter sp.]|uniref:hypothetical protein n=1 Tax=Paenirhodobacter sp. TaxID=1965326 RepID=UPI003B3EE7F8